MQLEPKLSHKPPAVVTLLPASAFARQCDYLSVKRLDLHVTITHSHCCCIEVSLMQLMHKSAQA